METLQPTASPTTSVTTDTSSSPAASLKFDDWGTVDYNSALRRQMDLVDLVHHEHARETVVFCSHPAVVTLGRGTLEGDVFAWTGETIEVNRGGRATYHGPNQIVSYPILDLSHRSRDLHKYMRDLEEVIVRTLADFGIQSTGRNVAPSDVASSDEAPDATGVWVGSKKIASIGIGVRKWVAFHGLALNVDYDPAAFQGMKPCGFTTETMISMEEILGAKVDRAAVIASMKKHMLEILAI